MTTEIWYEWDIETYSKDEYEDIVEHNFSDTLSFTPAHFTCNEDEATRLVLVRNEGNEVDGLEDRFWAYVKDGKLPEYFEDGSGHEIDIKVPQKYHKELKTFFK